MEAESWSKSGWGLNIKNKTKFQEKPGSQMSLWVSKFRFESDQDEVALAFGSVDVEAVLTAIMTDKYRFCKIYFHIKESWECSRKIQKQKQNLRVGGAYSLSPVNHSILSQSLRCLWAHVGGRGRIVPYGLSYPSEELTDWSELPGKKMTEKNNEKETEMRKRNNLMCFMI